MLLALLIGCVADPAPSEPTGTASEPTPAASSTVPAPVPTTPPPTVPDPTAWADLREALEAQGLAVHAGRVTFEGAEDCCSWESCLHVNPNAAYGTWAVPPHPDEYVGDRIPDAFGHLVAPRLRADEALLYVGPPPPGAAYTSIRSYVNDAETPEGRDLAFTSLGDSLNAGVWTESDAGELLVLTTAHATTAERVAAAAASVGRPPPDLDIVPADVAVMGHDATADALRVTLRVVGLTDPEAFEAFRDAPTASVWRLTPTEVLPEAPLEPLPYRQPEAATDPALDDAVERLRLALIAGHPDHEAQESLLEVLEPPVDAPCWQGCNRDVSYTQTRAVPLRVGEKLVAYGVDPAALGHATWTSVVLHGLENNDAGGGAGTAQLAGSADAWLPGDPDLDKLYVWSFARDCGGDPYCSEVPYTCPGIGVAELARVVWRHYEDPVTHAFPPDEGLGPRGALRLLPTATTP